MTAFVPNASGVVTTVDDQYARSNAPVQSIYALATPRVYSIPLTLVQYVPALQRHWYFWKR